MFCPFCNDNDTKVIDSRLVEESNQVRRRRECLQCKERFTSYEKAELALPSIVKRDGRRSEFAEEKIRRGLTKALEKRPVNTEKIEEIIAHIKGHLRASGEREVDSDQIGLLIMDELRALDQVAYVRFASVYRDFQDVDAFKKEIDKLLVRKMSQISPKKRHKARSFAVQALYHWQLTQDNINEVLVHFLKDINANKTDTEYFQMVLRDISKQVSTLDGLFTPFLDRPIDDIGPVELAILRLGTYELAEHPEIPYKVVLNEAVELTKTFGPEDAHKYINGVLDKVAAECRVIEVKANND